MTCAGSQRYGTGSLWCAYPGGKLAGLGHALAISCNVAFANLGAEASAAPPLVDELRRFGFDRTDAPGAGRIRQPQGDERQLADLSVGLEATEITPAHAARMAAVFGTDGTMPGVFLVAAEDGAMGMSPRPPRAAAARRVLEAAWIPRDARGDGGRSPAPGGPPTASLRPSFPVAMKTGTASTPGLGYHVNYIGVGPMPDPTVAFCVRVTHRLLVARGQRRRARGPGRPPRPGSARDAPQRPDAGGARRVSSAQCRSSGWTSAWRFRPPSSRRTGCSPSAATSGRSGCSPRTRRASSPGTRTACRSSGTRPTRGWSCAPRTCTSRAAWPRRCAAATYQVTLDSAFRDVVEACASMERPGQEGTWITAEMIAAYEVLHRLGFAHSVEAWRGDELVGGLYGVSLGSAFFGESMFARADDASKVAFVTLVRDLARARHRPHRLPGAHRAPRPLRRRGMAARALPARRWPPPCATRPARESGGSAPRRAARAGAEQRLAHADERRPASIAGGAAPRRGSAISSTTVEPRLNAPSSSPRRDRDRLRRRLVDRGAAGVGHEAAEGQADAADVRRPHQHHRHAAVVRGLDEDRHPLVDREQPRHVAHGQACSPG